MIPVAWVFKIILEVSIISRLHTLHESAGSSSYRHRFFIWKIKINKEPYRTCIKTCPTHKIAKKLLIHFLKSNLYSFIYSLAAVFFLQLKNIY